MIRSLQVADRFMTLSAADRGLILEASFYLLCAKIATLTTPTRTLLALGKIDHPTKEHTASLQILPEEITSSIRALDVVCRRLTFANCLTRAVALRMMLAQRNIATQMHIGARKDEAGQFAAHAWLTFKGRILVGGDEDVTSYRELAGLSHSLLL